MFFKNLIKVSTEVGLKEPVKKAIASPEITSNDKKKGKKCYCRFHIVKTERSLYLCPTNEF